jgi:hypothetical protein
MRRREERKNKDNNRLKVILRDVDGTRKSKE